MLSSIISTIAQIGNRSTANAAHTAANGTKYFRGERAVVQYSIVLKFYTVAIEKGGVWLLLDPVWDESFLWLGE